MVLVHACVAQYLRVVKVLYTLIKYLWAFVSCCIAERDPPQPFYDPNLWRWIYSSLYPFLSILCPPLHLSHPPSFPPYRPFFLLPPSLPPSSPSVVPGVFGNQLDYCIDLVKQMMIQALESSQSEVSSTPCLNIT